MGGFCSFESSFAILIVIFSLLCKTEIRNTFAYPSLLAPFSSNLLRILVLHFEETKTWNQKWQRQNWT